MVIGPHIFLYYRIDCINDPQQMNAIMWMSYDKGSVKRGTNYHRKSDNINLRYKSASGKKKSGTLSYLYLLILHISHFAGVRVNLFYIL